MSRFVAATERGRDRHRSQDRVFVDEARAIGAVLDGHGADGRSADLLIEALQKRLALLPPGRVDREQIDDVVRQSISAVFRAACADSRLRGAGTTLDLISLQGASAWIAHVGDGRVYHVGSGVVRQVTSDHTLVAEAVARGEMTAEEAAASPHRNVITRAVGAVRDTPVDIVELTMAAGDFLVACTDAVWKEEGETFVIDACQQSSAQAIVNALLYRSSPLFTHEARCSDDASVLVVTP